jgi:hypothetical protein
MIPEKRMARIDDMNPCPKCQKPMLEGYTPGFNGSMRSVPMWIAGAPERSIWTGLKIHDKDKIPIQVFRCSGCGYLESYAKTTD